MAEAFPYPAFPALVRDECRDRAQAVSRRREVVEGERLPALVPIAVNVGIEHCQQSETLGLAFLAVEKAIMESVELSRRHVQHLAIGQPQVVHSRSPIA